MAFKNFTCKGSYALGSACGYCERCKEEWDKMDDLKKCQQVTADMNAALDTKHDDLIAQLKALLYEKRTANGTYNALCFEPREGLSVDKELSLDLRTRKACIAAARADQAYQEALDEYTKEFPNA